MAMLPKPSTDLTPNTLAFEMMPLVKPMGFREYDARWWFGHPGSTVIYPLAGAFRVWETVAHHGSLVGEDPGLTARFHRHPTGFYVIGRLWTIALSVGTAPLMFLIGRRAFNTRRADRHSRVGRAP